MFTKPIDRVIVTCKYIEEAASEHGCCCLIAVYSGSYPIFPCHYLATVLLTSIGELGSQLLHQLQATI